MRKLTPRFFLPAAQLLVAVVLFHWGYVAYLPKGLDTAYVPTGRLICDGINAPARLITNFIEAALPGKWRWQVVGSKLEILIFLTCIGLLWYLVGRELDPHRTPKAGPEARITPAGLLFNAFLVLSGILLAISAVINFGHLRDLGRWNNFVGNIVEGVFYWAWSLILIIFPGVNLVNAMRNKGRVTGGPDFE